MAKILKNRGLQYPLVAEFTLNLTDTMVMTDGVEKAFTVAAPVADIIGLPPSAVVVGGDVTVETVSDDTGTATIAVGDSGSATRYLTATSIKSAARTALTLTGFRGNGEDIRITLANQNGNATAGKVTVRVQYIVTGRTNEVQVA